MIFNKAFENVFTLENGLVTHVDFDLLEQNTSYDFVDWLGFYLRDDVYVIKGVFATHEYLVLIMVTPLKDDFRIARLVLSGSYKGETDIDGICLPELQMMNSIMQVTI